MKSGTPFEQGAIVLIPFPFTDLTTTKKRPVLVLSKTEYNMKSEDFICCGITSNPRNVQHSVAIRSRDLSAGRLPKPSRIRVDKVFTLEKSLTIRSLGKVKSAVFEKVRQEFYQLF